MDVSLEDTQKKLDKALKRNLVGQQAQTKPITPTTTTKLAEPEVSDADQVTETED